MSLAQKYEQPIPWDQAKTANTIPRAVIEAGDSVEWLDNGSSCSGQFLSNSGYFLTALHCIAKSILNDGPNLSYTLGKQQNYKGWFVREFDALPYQTSSIVDSRHLHLQNENQEPRVIALGKGYFEIPPQVDKSNFESKLGEVENLKQFQEDFSLLHFKLAQNNKHSCIKLSERIPDSGELAWLVGFPGDAISRNSTSTPTKYVLIGKLYNSFDDYKKASGKITNYPEEAWFDENRLMLLTGLPKSGMSGGAIIDSNGHVVGIAIAGLSDIGVTIVQRATFIKSELLRINGEEQLTRILDCTTK